MTKKHDDYDYGDNFDVDSDYEAYNDYMDYLDENAERYDHVDGYSVDQYKAEITLRLVEAIDDFLTVGTVSELLKIVAENT